MPFTEIILLISLIFMLVMAMRDQDRSRLKVLNGRLTLARLYWETIAFLWLPVGFLFIHISFNPTAFASLGLTWSSRWQNLASLLALTCITVYFGLSIRTLKKHREKREELRPQLDSVRWFMPKTQKEIRLFVLGVSVSAGICEELLFRGYLIGFLSYYLGTSTAVILSSALFGLAHSYQGRLQAFKTFVVGLLLALIYVFSGSLLVPILLHICLDIYGGVAAYLTLKDEPEVS